jgi:PAS domain S-box-containing protein
VGDKPLQQDGQRVRLSLKIAVIYAVLGASWIFFSDKIAETIARTPEVLTQIAIIKGWLYVVVTALLLYHLVSRGIKELESSQEALLRVKEDWERTFDTVPDLIAILDNAYRIVRANRAMAAKLGVAPGECAGLRCYHAVHGASEPPSFCPHRQLLADGLEHTTEVHDDRLGGDFVVSVSPLLDPAGKVVGSVHVARDITERKRVEDALRESEERWQFALEGAGDGVWDWNPQTNEVFFSRQWKAMLGYEEDEIGNTLDEWDKRVHPEDKEQCYADLHEHLSGEKRVYQNEHRVLCKDGTYKWILDRGKVIESADDGKPLRVIGTHTDITDRKQAQNALKESEGKYRQLFEIESDALFLIEVESLTILEVNASTEALYGYDRSEFLAMRSSDVSAEPERTASAIEEGVNHVSIRWHRKKDGTVFPVEISGTYFVLGEKRVHLAAIREITKRMQMEQSLKESEERLQLAIWGADLGMWDCNMETNDFSRNARWAEMLGYSVEEIEPHLGSWQKLIHPEDMPRTMDLWNAHREGRIPYYESEHRLLAKSGDWVWVLSKGKVTHFDEQGSALRAVGTHLDITDRKRAEEALHIANSFRESIIEHAGEGLCVCHGIPDYPFVRFTIWNRRMQEISGYSMEEINRVGWYQSVYPDLQVQKRAQERMARMRNGEDLQDEEWEITRSDGRKRILQIATTVLRSSDGLTHVLALMHDVTERKRAEDELRRTGTLVDMIVENIPNMIFLKDARNLEFVRFNRAGEDLVGYSRDELLGKSDYDFFPKEQADFFTEKDRQALHRKDLVDIPEESVQTRNKQIRTLHTKKVALLDANGEPEYLLGISEDITERRQATEALRKSEEKYRGIFDESVAAIFAFDNEKNFTDSNQAGLDLLGYSREELLCMSIPDVDADPVVVLPAHRQLLTGGRLINYKHQLRRKDGTVITVLNNSRPLTDLHGNVVGMLSTLIDITEIKLAEELLRATLQEKEVLLREIHHRVKNNMQVVSSLLAIQAEEVKNDQVRKALQENQQRIAAMAMIHETLYSGQGSSAIDLSSYLKSLVHHFQQLYSGRVDVRIELELDQVELGIDQAAPCALIVNELITNAFKHAFPEGSEGTIQIKTHLANEREVVLEVSDDGVGLPADLDLGNPSGLGLRLVQGLIRHQLRGSLDVAVGRGTAFILRWPLYIGKGGTL